jgi:hypothetical protein
MENKCTDRARRFLWPVKDTIYIKHLLRKQQTINYGEVLGFTAYKKIEKSRKKNCRRD